MPKGTGYKHTGGRSDKSNNPGQPGPGKEKVVPDSKVPSKGSVDNETKRKKPPSTIGEAFR